MKLPLSSEEEREAIAQLEHAIATDNVTAGAQQILNGRICFPLCIVLFPLTLLRVRPRHKHCR